MERKEGRERPGAPNSQQESPSPKRQKESKGHQSPQKSETDALHEKTQAYIDKYLEKRFGKALSKERADRDKLMRDLRLKSIPKEARTRAVLLWGRKKGSSIN